MKIKLFDHIIDLNKIVYISPNINSEYTIYFDNKNNNINISIINAEYSEKVDLNYQVDKSYKWLIDLWTNENELIEFKP